MIFYSQGSGNHSTLPMLSADWLKQKHDCKTYTTRMSYIMECFGVEFKGWPNVESDDRSQDKLISLMNVMLRVMRSPELTQIPHRERNVSFIFTFWEGRKEMFYLTTHSTHFIYGYMASDIW